jgi:hypothetical protein
MKLVKSLSQNYPDCIVTHFNYEKYVGNYKKDEDTCLSIGYNCLWNDKVHKYIDPFNRKIFFNGEHPCSYTQDLKFGTRTSGLAEIFTDVYTICPYTAAWLNEKYNGGKNKFKLSLFPIDKEIALQYNTGEKIYDSIFYGSICGKTHENIVNEISKFNYKFTTIGYQHWHPNEPVDLHNLANKVTDVNLTTFQKWDILSKTKIIPIVNHIFLHDDHIQNIKQYEGWQDNKAFSNIEDKIACQLKPRITEAGIFKMLMLVKKDPWNAIEFFYEPEKEFLYYEEEKELPDMIEEISNNWGKYEHIVENAHERAMNNYTTEAVLKTMMNNEEVKR